MSSRSIWWSGSRPRDHLEIIPRAEGVRSGAIWWQSRTEWDLSSSLPSRAQPSHPFLNLWAQLDLSSPNHIHPSYSTFPRKSLAHSKSTCTPTPPSDLLSFFPWSCNIWPHPPPPPPFPKTFLARPMFNSQICNPHLLPNRGRVARFATHVGFQTTNRYLIQSWTARCNLG